ncbi:MAG: DNA recombination protein RmuC [Ruminococcaceae bacterium]|nr:DNA recombination protein RmuC [Oscillospiraceae bacterium]
MSERVLIILLLLLSLGLAGLALGALLTLRRMSERLTELERRGLDSSAILSRQDMLIKSVDNSLSAIKSDLSSSAMQTEQKLDFLRRGLEGALTQMRRENNAQIDEIRRTVDEKLQDTLDQRLTRSFSQVSQRLEQVYKGLGEMQNLASGVGDLKRVLSNVKTRGILGEIQLGAILDQMLSPEQYGVNVAVKKGSQQNVEYAVRLPGNGDDCVWLPIDSKFPLDAYQQLLDAYDSADPAAVESASKDLRDRLRRFAKDIHDKYIYPPDTTDFAVMFLPSEGLYAEAVRIGMIELLQREYKVTIAGPTTLAALLNALQMGFRTLAIQKRSGEVWQILSAVKNEFDNFGAVLETTQKRILQANDELDRLVGVRTRRIQNTLRHVQSYTGDPQQSLWEENDDV